MGGKIKAMATPSVAPDKEPTKLISLKRVVNKAIRVSKTEDVRLTPPSAGIFLAAREINQFLMAINMRGKLASTDAPNDNLATIASGSLGDRLLRRNGLT